MTAQEKQEKQEQKREGTRAAMPGPDAARRSPLDLRAPAIVTSGGTASVQLTLAISDYEHVREITQGIVRADGVTLTPLIFPSIEEITFRFTRSLEWDVSELSFGKYTSLTSQAAPSASRNGRRPPASMCAASWPRTTASIFRKCIGCRPAWISRAAPRRSSSSCPPAFATRAGRR